ncbi:MAG: hypothetical protein WCG80_16645 [Spirochaetales bacterium]
MAIRKAVGSLSELDKAVIDPLHGDYSILMGKDNDYARTLFAWPGFAPSHRQTTRGEVLAVGELGFADGANLAQLWQRVRELGLHLGPAWRLVYLDQSEEVEIERHKAPRGSITVLSPRPSDAVVAALTSP